MKIRNLVLITLAAALVAGSSCSNEKGTGNGSPATAQAPAAAETSPKPAAGGTFAGKVVETMDAGAYTYVRVAAGGEEIWAASNRFAVAVGEQVVVPLDMPIGCLSMKISDRVRRILFLPKPAPDND